MQAKLNREMSTHRKATAMFGHLVIHQSLLCVLSSLSLFAEQHIVPFCMSGNDSSLTNSIKAVPELLYLYVLEKEDRPYT